MKPTRRSFLLGASGIALAPLLPNVPALAAPLPAVAPWFTGAVLMLVNGSWVLAQSGLEATAFGVWNGSEIITEGRADAALARPYPPPAHTRAQRYFPMS